MQEHPLAKKAEGRGPLGSGTEAARVLLVDDDEDTLQILQEVFIDHGYLTLTARDGTEALRVAQAFEPEVVLVDLGLPDMSGTELGAKLKKLPDLRLPGLIAFTGYAEEEHRHAAVLAGFDDYVLKPMDLEQLVGIVARLSARLHPLKN